MVSSNFLLLFISILSLCVPSSSHETRQFWTKLWGCEDTKGNFTLNSTYSLNLATAFSNLTSLSSSHSFSNVTVGSDDGVANYVYALYDCRNDLSLKSCRGCLEDATHNILGLCDDLPKEAVVIYEECMLRYANRNIFSTMELGPNYNNCAGVILLSNYGGISYDIMYNLEEVIEEATSKSSSMGYFAVKNGSYIDIAQRDFYFLVQCTPDLSRAQCKECLKDALNYTVESCARDNALWGTILGPSCQMRYDDVPFFNVSSDLIAVPPTPSPPEFSGQPLSVSIPKLSFSVFIIVLCLL